MNPIHRCPKTLSQLSSPTNFHKLLQIRKTTHISSTQLKHHRKYSSDHPPEKPPPEFPAAPQPDKPSESSEVPSAPDSTPPPQNRVPVDDPYGSGAAMPQKGSKSRVRQPHGAEVKTPTPPEPADMFSS